MKWHRLILLVAFYIGICLEAGAQKSNYIGINITPSVTKLTGHFGKTKYPFAMAYGFGLTGFYSLNSKMFLRIGVGYKLKREVVENMPYIPNDVGPNLNNHDGSDFKFTQNNNYITVPVRIGYIFKKYPKSNTAYFVSGGIELNTFYGAKATNHYSYGDEVHKWDARQLNMGSGIAAGAGVFFNLSENLMILIEPSYSYDVYHLNQWDMFQSILLNIEFNCKLKSKS